MKSTLCRYFGTFMYKEAESKKVGSLVRFVCRRFHPYRIGQSKPGLQGRADIGVQNGTES
jgi:hypothetical protein